MGNPTHASRSITAAGLARLLASLDADRERAALHYERLRWALIKFFDWRGAWPPDECADETLDRLARKLEEGTNIADVDDYAHGIARLVWLEWQRKPRSAPADALVDLPQSPPNDTADDDRLHRCLDVCLDAVPADARSLLLGYYEGERRAKILNRQRLAADLGLSDAALRSRIHRLRDSLERCVRECMTRAEREP